MNNIKNLSRLMVFALVARKGSFTQAAEELDITKSAVSQQIKALELDIGARLLNRTTRGVAATALGEKLLQRCQLLHDQLDMVFADVTEAGLAPKGRFAVTFPHALASNVALPAIELLCQEYPGLEPDLIASDSELDLVTHGLDVAIHAGELPDSSYRALPVGQMIEVFCASPLYLRRSGQPKTLSDLAEHRWIAASWQQRHMAVQHVATQDKTMVNLYRFAQVNTLPSAIELALRNMGLVLIPDVVAKPLLQSGELVRVLPQFTGPHWPVHAIHAYQSEKPVHVARFYQIVCRYFDELVK
ncbi:LysR family transcriptional regulator [Undibacterium umbellatum]|uniref:LysR family transcriptional regulator n=1 Tax=Undibacterium umbellatum TaxID=2762300 RepID=A0ABR6ZHV6_9BURK|nr:LysR family transcriptional regulator [Undibacterium umbellatum]MBC3911264.1 LysR family transcriptional regulator [Undibacterium umbellatum]